jgi:hypothetical protein
LFRAEESLDETNIREGLELDIMEPGPKLLNSTDDNTMVPMVHEATNLLTPLTTTTTNQPDISNEPSLFAQAHQSKIVQPTLKSPLPLTKPPLYSSIAQVLTPSSSTAPVTAKPASAIAPMDDDEDDEEMPVIDMNSDSD